MSHCKDCRFFEPNPPTSDVKFGYCSRPESDGALFFPNSMEEAVMCVFPNFGCVQFKEKKCVIG